MLSQVVDLEDDPWHKPEPWHVRVAVLVPGPQVTSQWLQPLHCVQWASSCQKWKYIFLFQYLDPKYRVTSSWQARITRRRAPSLIGWSAPVNETRHFGSSNCNYDKCIIYLSNVIWISWINCSKFIYWKLHIFERINGILLCVL